MLEPTEEEKAAAAKAAEDKAAAEAAAQKKEVPTEDPEKKPSAADDRISQANAAAARMEEANKKYEELLERQEAMKVENTLGGSAEAGAPAEVDENAGAKKLLEGTGLEDVAFPPPAEKKPA